MFSLVNQLWFKNICQCKILKSFSELTKFFKLSIILLLDVKLADSFPTKGSLSLIYTSRILGQVIYETISINRWKFFWGCTNLVYTIPKETAKSIYVTISTILSDFLLFCYCCCVPPYCETSVPTPRQPSSLEARRPSLQCIADWAIVNTPRVKFLLCSRGVSRGL